MTKDTPNGRIISYCPISPEMEAAADECFAAYKALNEKVAKFHKTIPERFGVKNFYGAGDCVIINSDIDREAEAKYWEENP
jgi:hypothetical protein